MSIRKVERKEGTAYQVYGRKNGKTIYLGSYPSRSEAEDAEAEARYVRKQIREGRLPEDTDPRRTFAEAAKTWEQSLKRRRSRSASQYGYRLEKFIRPELGQMRLTEITSAVIEDLRDLLCVRMAPSTVNSTLGCLSSAFAYFKRQGWVGVNPCHGVKPAEMPNADSYNWIKTRSEATKLLAACKQPLRDMVAFALATGLRQDEQLHLRWDDVDLSRRLITVHRGRQGTTKSGKVRYVPIVDTLLPVLRRRHLERAGAALVFPGRDEGHRKPNALRAAYKRAVKRAALDDSLRWHDLRHTMATYYMQDGGDLYRLSKLLGHSSIRQTEKYAHHDPSMFVLDHGRVTFEIPEDRDADVLPLKRVR